MNLVAKVVYFGEFLEWVCFFPFILFFLFLFMYFYILFIFIFNSLIGRKMKFQVLRDFQITRIMFLRRDCALLSRVHTVLEF